MKEDDLEKMKASHSARLRFIENQLKNFYDEMSEEQQDKWLDDLLKTRAILEWLEQQKPD